MGLEVSLADNDTFAARSIRVLVTSHGSEPFIPRSVFKPAALSFVFPFSLCKFFENIKFGLVEVAGELLLVHHDGIVVLLEIADSTS